MAKTRERKVASPDLDIFGDDANEASEEERDADSKSMDIFGEDAAEEADKAETSEEGAGEGSEKEGGAEKSEEAGEPDWASIFGDTSEGSSEGGEQGNEAEAKDTGAEGEEKLDPEIDDLLSQVEAADEKDERDDVIAELRKRLVDQQVEIDSASHKQKILNEKLMASAASDTELGMYKDVIAKLDGNPKLRALVRYSDATDEYAKNRAVNILAEMLEDFTGQDVSSLLDKTRNDKAKAALGGGPSASQSSNKEEKEENMDYDESVSSMW